MDKLKNSWKQMQTRGFLTERKDDPRFTSFVQQIIEEIFSEWEKEPNSHEILLPNYDLHIKIVNNSTDSDYGCFYVSHITKHPTIELNVAGVSEDLFTNKKYLEILKKYSSVLFHELIHYVNYFSFKDDERQLKYYDNKHPYNNSMEFNAYYHQVRKMMVDALSDVLSKNLKFSDYFGKHVQEFIPKFFTILDSINKNIKSELDDKYRAKWLKRIYQLYFELKDEYNIKKGKQ